MKDFLGHRQLFKTFIKGNPSGSSISSKPNKRYIKSIMATQALSTSGDLIEFSSHSNSTTLVDIRDDESFTSGLSDFHINEKLDDIDEVTFKTENQNAIGMAESFTSGMSDYHINEKMDVIDEVTFKTKIQDAGGKVHAYRYATTPMIPIIVGTDAKKIFYIHAGLLRHLSAYFRGLIDDTDFDVGSDILTLPGCQEVVFAYFVEFAYGCDVARLPIEFEDEYLQKAQAKDVDKSDGITSSNSIPATTWIHRFLLWYALAIRIESDSFKAHLVEEFPRLERSTDSSCLSLDDIRNAYSMTAGKDDPIRKLFIKILCFNRELHQVLADIKIITLCKEGGDAADDVMGACADMAYQLDHKLEIVQKRQAV